MAANTSPIFTLTPNVTPAIVTAGDSSLTAPTNSKVLYTPGANGGIVEAVNFKALGTSTAGMIRLFLLVSAVYYLLEEIPVTAITPSGTVAAWSGSSALITPANPLTLPSGAVLRFTSHNTDATYAGVAQAGDF